MFHYENIYYIIATLNKIQIYNMRAWCKSTGEMSKCMLDESINACLMKYMAMCNESVNINNIFFFCYCMVCL